MIRNDKERLALSNSIIGTFLTRPLHHNPSVSVRRRMCKGNRNDGTSCEGKANLTGYCPPHAMALRKLGKL